MKNLAVQYLKRNNYHDAVEEFEDSFFSHPNYPSIYAITDTFDSLDIENLAVKIPAAQFGELPDVFLAVLEDEMTLVQKTDNFLIVETDDGVKRELPFDAFFTAWEGVTILIEPSVRQRKAARFPTRWLLYALPLLALVALSAAANPYSVTEWLLLFTTTAGTVLGIFIIQEKMGIKNDIASKICSLNPATSCNSVINSGSGTITKWIGLVDFPLIFFGSGLLSILLQPLFSGIWIVTASVICLPMVVYSIILQKFRIKSWCILCLLVSTLIVAQAALFVGTTAAWKLPVEAGFYYFFCLLFTAAFWLLARPVLNAKTADSKKLKEVMKFKRNYEVFDHLAKKVPVFEGFNKLKGLHFGEQYVPVYFSLILSPSCVHCHKALQAAFALLEKYPGRIFLNVLFNINPENEDNPYRAVVESLLMINDSEPHLVTDAITDWHINRMPLEKWKQKWQPESLSMKVNHQIHEQYDWCMKNEFNYTPVRILNDRLVPPEYEIDDIRYFLNDFAEKTAATAEETVIEA